MKNEKSGERCRVSGLALAAFGFKALTPIGERLRLSLGRVTSL
jgi:hypothetical protein